MSKKCPYKGSWWRDGRFCPNCPACVQFGKVGVPQIAYFPRHEGPGVTLIGQWLARLLVRITPKLMVYPYGCKWRDATSVELCFRQLDAHALQPFQKINFRAHSAAGPTLVLWRKKKRHHA
jgi:hypothetical protein